MNRSLASLPILLALGCRGPTAPPATAPTTAPQAALVETPVERADDQAVIASGGPKAPNSAAVVFRWTEDYIAQFRDWSIASKLETQEREIPAPHRVTATVKRQGSTIHFVEVQVACSDRWEDEEEPDAMWWETFTEKHRTYYMFEGQLLAVREVRSVGYSENAGGTCVQSEDTESFFIWRDRLLAHWTDTLIPDCSAASDATETDDTWTTRRPKPSTVEFSDDSVVAQLQQELEQLLAGEDVKFECTVEEAGW